MKLSPAVLCFREYAGFGVTTCESAEAPIGPLHSPSWITAQCVAARGGSSPRDIPSFTRKPFPIQKPFVSRFVLTGQPGQKGGETHLMPRMAGEVHVAHTGDVHLEEDRYFGDTTQCLEWFVCDAIRAGVALFVINGDLTTYKATIKERNLWIDMLIRMADHAPVIVTAGNHGRELSGDLYVYSRAKGRHPIQLCTEPELVEVGEFAVAVFPYPRKAELMGTSGEAGFQAAFGEQIAEFGRQFARRPDRYKLFFGHFGVAGARVSSGQPLAGRCAEYALEPLRALAGQYVGLSHIHLRQQLAPRLWYSGSL